MYQPGTHRRIALLICDVPADSVREQHGDYTRIFGTLLEESLKPINKTHSADSQTTFTLEPFDVRMQVYPKEDDYDAILITGSGAWKNIDWMKKLIEYVRVVATEKPRIKIFGICFGHQIVALAMGGTCVRNTRFEVSATKLQLTELGKRVYGIESGNIHLMNRDHVPTKPPSFHVLASSSQSPIHGMVLFSQSESLRDASHSNFRLTDIHILTSQGHPEFTESIMRLLLGVRRGILGPEIFDDGQSRASNQNDGIAVVGKAIWGVMGVE
ncbi:class I glutamine amidotransferase-like protein [Suillus fuscotomentosus]|uniref:Class I glutamine amidotransferase-like protein n=1 Tax=Suillus fuscotomentosus TaxID=1912939 RepID=A0AAD4HLZ6_9AGAM|nr:class I glutamine amidotransferase-like protein [Suillus fuscotomentosus]KAG1901528.1 class I glutamine amidotransferase-like protein [Suillus fuscotomentosus]